MAGRILGIVGTILAILVIVGYGILFAIVGTAGFAG